MWKMRATPFNTNKTVSRLLGNTSLEKDNSSLPTGREGSTGGLTENGRHAGKAALSIGRMKFVRDCFWSYFISCEKPVEKNNRRRGISTTKMDGFRITVSA
jgi:hypothetical protein